jgi:hypothetical protein
VLAFLVVVAELFEHQVTFPRQRGEVGAAFDSAVKA